MGGMGRGRGEEVEKAGSLPEQLPLQPQSPGMWVLGECIEAVRVPLPVLLMLDSEWHPVMSWI